MDVLKDRTKCTGCTTCEHKCPHKCIEMQSDANGFKYPFIDMNRCTECDVCRIVCPVNDKVRPEKDYTQKVFAVKNQNTEIQYKSSSGGAFTSLSEKVLGDNGVVFGAVIDDDMRVVHTSAEASNEIEAFRGSKYVQSDLSDIFPQIKAHLKNGKKVLFSGAPCQVAGLNSYIGKKRDNLITVDFACAGVPSPGLWEDYVSFIEEKEGSKLTNFFFRDKSRGWKMGGHTIVRQYQNGKTEKIPFGKDFYGYLFGNSISIRSCCDTCIFTNLNREADITLADFWAINEAAPEWNDAKGVSEVIVNTEKGYDLFSSCSDLQSKECDIDKSLQPCFIQPKKISARSKEFWKEYHELGIPKIVNKYKNPSLLKRVIKKLRSLVLKGAMHN